jgi:peroxiredoxin family protein
VSDERVSTLQPDVAVLAERLAALERKVSAGVDPDRMSMVVFSGELDKLLAAFVIATGAAASSMQVSMYFTFWGLAALRKAGPQARGKRLIERAFGWLVPGGHQRRKLSKLDMGGLGRRILRREMRRRRVADLPTLIEAAAASGVEVRACEMAMSLMGVRREELIDYPGLEVCGVACFLEQASKSGTTLFI